MQEQEEECERCIDFPDQNWPTDKFEEKVTESLHQPNVWHKIGHQTGVLDRLYLHLRESNISLVSNPVDDW